MDDCREFVEKLLEAEKKLSVNIRNLAPSLDHFSIMQAAFQRIVRIANEEGVSMTDKAERFDQIRTEVAHYIHDVLALKERSKDEQVRRVDEEGG
jgi:hypothetical protein